MRQSLFFLAFLLHQAASTAQGVNGPGFGWAPFCQSLFRPLGPGGTLALYYASLLALYALYVRILAEPGPVGKKSCWAAATTAALLVITPASRSTDVYAYLAHGHNGAANLKAAHSAEIFPAGHASPYLDELASRTGLVGHGPTPYGPLWTHLEILSYRATAPSLPLGAFLLKALAALGLAGAAALTAAIAGPQAGLALFLNPFLLTEFAAEGHNDALMLLFCLAGFWALARKGAGSAASFALGLGVLTKYLPALLGGAVLRFSLNKDRSSLARLFAGGVLAAVAGFFLYYPLWIGAETFHGVGDNAGAFPAVARPILGFLKSSERAAAIFGGAMKLGFLLFAARVSWSAQGFEALVKASVLLFLGYLLFFPPYVWPWYLALPVAFLYLLPGTPYRRLGLLLSLNASLAGPVWALYKIGFFSPALGKALEHALLPGLTILILFFAYPRALDPAARRA